MMITNDVRKRFLEKIDMGKSCWIWNGTIGSNGYGYIAIKRKNVLAHRISFLIFEGEIGAKFVLHKCNVPSCVNPKHLYLGTQKENIADQINSGTFIYGSKHPLSKLTEDNVRKIIELSSFGISQRKIARFYKVDQALIWRVIHRVSWPHVK